MSLQDICIPCIMMITMMIAGKCAVLISLKDLGGALSDMTVLDKGKLSRCQRCER